MFPDEGGRPRFMFPDKGEADDRVPVQGGGRRLCSQGRGDGDYVYEREGLCARARNEGEAGIRISG